MSIYLDNNRATKVDPQVFAKMEPLLKEIYGDLNAPHSDGVKSRKVYIEAMEKIYAGIHAGEADDIFITSGQAENLSTLLMGIYLSKILTGRKNNIIISKRASLAEMEVVKLIESQGAKVNFLPVNKDGIIDPQSLYDYLTPRTAIVSIPMVDEESGAINPVEEIAQICKKYEVPIHIDATQAIGKIPVDVQELDVDMLSFSAETIHAPAGTGAFYLKKDAEFLPVIFGHRNQYELYRGGPLNLSGIVGLGKAIELASDSLEFEMEDVREYRDMLEEALTQINGVNSPIPWALRVPNTLLLTVEGIESELLLYELNRNEISAYSYTIEPFGNWKREPIVDALGLDKRLRHSTIGFALSRFTTKEEIDTVIKKFKESVDYLRDFSITKDKK